MSTSPMRRRHIQRLRSSDAHQHGQDGLRSGHWPCSPSTTWEPPAETARGLQDRPQAAHSGVVAISGHPSGRPWPYSEAACLVILAAGVTTIANGLGLSSQAPVRPIPPSPFSKNAAPR